MDAYFVMLRNNLFANASALSPIINIASPQFNAWNSGDMQRSSEGEENNSLIMILYPTLPKNDTRYIQMPWIAEI